MDKSLDEVSNMRLRFFFLPVAQLSFRLFPPALRTRVELVAVVRPKPKCWVALQTQPRALQLRTLLLPKWSPQPTLPLSLLTRSLFPISLQT